MNSFYHSPDERLAWACNHPVILPRQVIHLTTKIGSFDTLSPAEFGGENTGYRDTRKRGFVGPFSVT